MHRHRLPAPPPPSAAEPLPDKAHGFLWWCQQGALMFGANRHEPRPTRMVLSLARGSQLTAVLPATTRSNDRFFPLPASQTRLHGCREARDSWLCPRYEVVRNEQLEEAGIVDQNTRVGIVRWLGVAR